MNNDRYPTYIEALDKIADLEAKLEEKERQVNVYAYEIAFLDNKLAEKEKEIEEMRHFKVTIGTMENNRVDISSTTYTDQKTDFAIEQLEKVKETLYPELRFDYSLYLRVMHEIDNQIKELKEGK